jgi:hypothetical protein|tara:strand:- start:2720 stop:3079 length:360 start_codon:yes stop_codon:yes gene_type:complete
MVDDPEPTNLAAELALSRGLLQDHLDKFVDGVMLDSQTIGNIQNMIQGIAVLVEKIDRIANRDTIVATDVVFLLQAVSAIVKTYVTDEQYADFTTKLARAVTDHSSLAGRRTVEGRVSG